ncbi:membrane protein [Ecytonucleospora hepatopenaei]|uniref:Membrane protein n=1 Tax=Ecytonucleospora hepatopenaei TaxID=646526 RepID=A0A1W0E318_9MICR|nr:membrane protein [Ecytonucleospora hepatopenaei]
MVTRVINTNRNISNISHNNRLVNEYNIFLSAMLAYYSAISFGYLDPARNACSYAQGVLMCCLTILITYPIRLVGDALAILVRVGKNAKLFHFKESLKYHAINSSVFLVVLLLALIMIGSYCNYKKYNYLLSLLIGSTIWTPLIHLVKFHGSIRYIASCVIGSIMYVYVSNNIQMFVYTPKDSREHQILFIMIYGIMLTLNIALVAIV